MNNPSKIHQPSLNNPIKNQNKSKGGEKRNSNKVKNSPYIQFRKKIRRDIFA